MMDQRHDDVFRLRKYIYSDVKYINNYDGNTILVNIRKGFDMGFGFVMYGEKEVVVKLMGIEAYSLNDPDDENSRKAVEAKDLVREKMLEAERSGDKIILITFKDRKSKNDKYLGWFYIGSISDETCLNNMLKNYNLTTGRFEKNTA